MPKRIATISVTVVRDGKRVSTGPGTAHANKPFDYTQAEIEAVTKQHATAFRKPVNEEAEDSVGEDATAPEGDASATATKTPKRPKAEKAAQKSSTSKAATSTEKVSGEPKDTAQNAPDGDDGDADEDDDI